MAMRLPRSASGRARRASNGRVQISAGDDCTGPSRTGQPARRNRNCRTLEPQPDSVRVALQRLHQQGFIVDAAGSRVFRFSVAPLTREDTQALYDTVAELDGLSAQYAAGIPAKARRHLVRSLRTLNDELRAAARASRPDHNQIYEVDHAFHDCYI